jgi:monoamine oxidase
MNDDTRVSQISRRRLLTLIGEVAGSAVMYDAMTSFGMAAESSYAGPVRLAGDAKGTSVLVLGAGLAGLVAALELQNAGYTVKVLEGRAQAGGRSRTIRGGDDHVELGAPTQTCRFDQGLYFNCGAWRIPYHHRGLLDYCRRLGVALEPFVQVNQNAYLHVSSVFGGAPQRHRHVQADFHGHIAELLAKATDRGRLAQPVSREDKEILLEALRAWGALDRNYAYRASAASSARRGYASNPGGGLSGRAQLSKPLAPDDVLRSGLWRSLAFGMYYNFQGTMLQPVGGMDRIADALAREVGSAITFGANVTSIGQSENGVTVDYRDDSGRQSRVSAAWCVCTIPLPVLRRLEIAVSRGLRQAIHAVPYAPAVKVGLQFKRRFWEEDEAIYGGTTFTDLPISQISYPSHGFLGRKGVLLGTYVSGDKAAGVSALSSGEQVKLAVELGSKIHPQYTDEFDNGIAITWSRDPWTQGCYAQWDEQDRARHYKALCDIDGRIVLAGEHASYLNGWQEGAVLSALDAVTRLHRRVLGT